MDYVFHIMDIPLFYYAIVVDAAVVLFLCKRKLSLCLLLPYLFLILSFTILVRYPSTDRHLIFQPFWSYEQWHKQREQVISNIFMFIPVGALASDNWSWKSIPFASGFSLLIEFSQFLTRRGYCEFDDIFHNTLGTIIGVFLYFGIIKIYKYYSYKLQQNNR